MSEATGAAASGAAARPLNGGRAAAGLGGADVPAVEVAPGVLRSVLPGGLRVVTQAAHDLRSATFGIWARVGSRDETAELNGATHYLEHLLFKGTERRTALDISAAVDAVGGEMNAFTAKEYTCYYARVLDADLPLAVDVVCDMLTSSLIRAEDLDAERGVILEEIAMTEDDPGDLVHDVFAEAVFGPTALGRPVLGTEETVEALDRDRVAEFYRHWYRPENLVVAAAGRLDHQTVVAAVHEAFSRAGALPDSPADSPTPHIQPADPATGPHAVRPAEPAHPVRHGAFQVVRRDTEQAHLVLGVPGLSRTDDRRWALGVLNAVLGGGMSSRLFQEVREKRGLAYSVYSFTSSYADAGLFGVYAGCQPARAAEVLRICRDELRAVAEKGISAEELRRGIGQISGSTVLGLEDTGALMSRIGKSELCWGSHLTVDEVLDNIARVTPEEVHAIAAELLAGPLSLAAIGPFDDATEEGLRAVLG
ncbi:M16 family metallopeptidase [Allostreptomyces psammosilenae]|uniref:Putative Zn-dependent peptidase n=1 Tax=Allostreptomyces psammosilenae TaxID=1892865 RepID=A0A853ADR0_9ACTN|nr:pitrilysin family protein [Allostreptomyces psammosilenae]NYI08462.1 putative Zn-dependent peptidase [Allostreptomyces psammosilenae]